MKFLSTFKITKGFDAWLDMYKDIEPSLNELGIKILWAGTNADETKVFDVCIKISPGPNLGTGTSIILVLPDFSD